MMKKLIVMGLIIVMMTGCALRQAQLDAQKKAASSEPAASVKK